MTRKPTNGDVALGVNRAIDRRDFLNGVAVTAGLIGSGLAGAAAAWPQDEPSYDPAVLTGLRGDHPGSFEAAHRPARRRFLVPRHAPLEDTGEAFCDLIIVGAGISGLSAAWFYRQSRPDARILILDNHDDFGGHAKRNAFHLDGRLQLLNGGTLEIDSPRPYSPAADGLIKALGIDPPALAKAFDRRQVYSDLGLSYGFFFDRETFGTDRLVAGAP